MLQKILQIFSKSDPQAGESWLFKHKEFFVNLSLVFLLSYSMATIVGSTVLPNIMKPLSVSSTMIDAGDSSQSVVIKNISNYHDIKKAIVDRNVFNRSGEFPSEILDEGGDKSRSFDIEAPCEKTALKIKLLGMISMGSSSLATIKEDGFESADVYKEGDFIIGADSASVVRIQRGRVIINNGGRKECLDIDIGEDVDKVKPLVKGNVPGLVEDQIFTVDLDSRFVQSELGEGFGKVIQSARLVPNIVNNQVNGFKIFSIQPGTVLDKIGFKENDVITKVNNIVMEAEQGFALYQALNDDKQIRISILREGTVPKTIVARIK